MKQKMLKGKTWTYRSMLYRRLGAKEEPYIKTEKEMLEDKVYDYETLSPSEKAIYNRADE